jgi:2-keto-3-deoxy-L-rhamnonate aldolase RhmA
MKTTHVRFVFAAFSVAVAMLSASSAYPTAQQKRIRLNKIIEQVEQGHAAISGQHWLFIDQEHSPYVIDKLEERFAAMAKDKDSNGRPRLTPIVRIPQEADEDFRWAVKQVLDAGTYGIVLPHLETKARGHLATSSASRRPLSAGSSRTRTSAAKRPGT